jgi:hypothetical protein
VDEVYEAGVTRVRTLPNTASSSVIGLGELRPLLADSRRWRSSTATRSAAGSIEVRQTRLRSTRFQLKTVAERGEGEMLMHPINRVTGHEEKAVLSVCYRTDSRPPCE